MKNCTSCGATLSRTNTCGLCKDCNPKVYKFKKPARLLENLNQGSYYREMLEKQKKLPSLEEHIENKKNRIERLRMSGGTQTAQ